MKPTVSLSQPAVRMFHAKRSPDGVTLFPIIALQSVVYKTPDFEDFPEDDLVAVIVGEDGEFRTVATGMIVAAWDIGDDSNRFTKMFGPKWCFFHTRGD